LQLRIVKRLTRSPYPLGQVGRRLAAAQVRAVLREYTGAGDGLRLKMLVLHDDAKREYAYGPAEGLPDTKVGTFTQDLYDEAKRMAGS
jgi:hypothetical protein